MPIFSEKPTASCVRKKLLIFAVQFGQQAISEIFCLDLQSGKVFIPVWSGERAIGVHPLEPGVDEVVEFNFCRDMICPFFFLVDGRFLAIRPEKDHVCVLVFVGCAVSPSLGVGMKAPNMFGFGGALNKLIVEFLGVLFVLRHRILRLCMELTNFSVRIFGKPVDSFWGEWETLLSGCQ